MNGMSHRVIPCGLILGLVLAAMAGRAGAGGPAEVNPFIGTGGKGFGVGSTFPGPCVPFGLARPGPDTASRGWNPSFYHCSGYDATDQWIRGFSHTRLSGIGVVEYGNVLVMPTQGGAADPSRERTYRSRFNHRTEQARPGYYAVTLADSGIRAELTATAHTGLHRYTFPKAGRGRIIVSASHAISRTGSCGAKLELKPEAREITGSVKQCGSLTGRNGGVEIYFAVRLSEPFCGFGVASDGRSRPGAKSGAGKNVGAYVDVETGPEKPVLVQVGISFISVDQARRHLDEELAGRSFEQVLGDAEKAWREALSLVEVTGGGDDQRTIFYTALYHAQIMPTDFTEAGGRYRGFDKQVHAAEGFRYYTDFSLWDTFRSLHPLLTLLLPGRAADMMQSLTLMAEQGGYLPKWPTAYVYTGCMVGASADNVLADSYLKGIRWLDVDKAYQAARYLAVTPLPEKSGDDSRLGIAEYIAKGYVPADRFKASASRTIEYSYNDWCLAGWAKALGKDEDARMFSARAKNYQNLWDPKTGCLRGKNADGSWKKPFASWIWTGSYAEGNARQWTLAPLHDALGLIELMGGKEAFVKRLNDFFEKSAKKKSNFLPGSYYWHGNEPDIHAAYLFDYAGRPDLTQKWVRWAMATKYKNAPDGLDGNDDCGTLSAWYVFSALGFYPVAGSDVYLIGSPIFEKAVMHLQGGDLTVRAEPDPAKNIYIRLVTLNGKKLEKPWFKHEQIAKGGELVFEMSEKPLPRPISE